MHLAAMQPTFHALGQEMEAKVTWGLLWRVQTSHLFQTLPLRECVGCQSIATSTNAKKWTWLPILKSHMNLGN